jgi:hypothetical protein
MITADFIRSLLDYNPETGHLTWRRNRSGTAYAGSRAGNVNCNGYRIIGLNGKRFQEHRICWLHFYGVLPDLDLDHINGNRSDNRIANLRPATDSQNQANKDASPRNTSCGVKGVTWHKRCAKWQASITINGKRRYLGVFASLDDAASAYMSAANDAFGEFAR